MMINEIDENIAVIVRDHILRSIDLLCQMHCLCVIRVRILPKLMK